MGKEDPIQLPDSLSTFKPNPEDTSLGATDNNQKYSSGNPQERNNYQIDDNQGNNPELKKSSNQEINQEIDLKKNRNLSITAALISCAIIPMVFLGLMAFGVVNVSSLILFSGYGASEVVLGLVGVSVVSQISLALVSLSGISKVKEKKLRVYDGINPSVEQDIYDGKLRNKSRKKGQENSQNQGNSNQNWQEEILRLKDTEKNSQRGI